MKKIGFILLLALVCKSLFSQQQDTNKWNFGATVKLGASNIYPGQENYSKDYPAVYPRENVEGGLSGGSKEKPGYYSSSEVKNFSYALGFSVQYNFSKTSAVETSVIFNNKSYKYPLYSSEETYELKTKLIHDTYYIDIPIKYQHSFLIGSKSKIRVSAGVTGCIFLFGDQNNEFFLDMYDKAVVIHRGNYRPIAMMINGTLEYVFPFFKNHIAVGPTFQIAPFSFTRKENTISSPHRYGGQTYEVSKHYEFKPYFIGAGITYYLR